MNNNYCCVPQCNSLGSRKPSTSFHRFPSINENFGIRRRQWIAKLRIGKKVTDRMVVCGKHFKSSDYFPSSAGENGLKRNNLKKTAVPSINLPTSSECTDEYERSVKLKKTTKPKLKEETPINKILIEDPRKDTCSSDEMDSHELSKSPEEMKNEIYLNSDEEHVEMENIEMRNEIVSNSTNNVTKKCLDKSQSSTEFSIKVPKYSDNEDISVNLRKWNKNSITPPSQVKKHCVFDFSLFKSSSDSKERLTQKLETALTVNASLQKKLEFYKNKCKTYEKEVKILKGVIDNLKLINSVASDY